MGGGKGTGGVADDGMGDLLRQLSQKVIEDRRMLLESQGLRNGTTGAMGGKAAPQAAADDPESLDTTFEDAYDDEDEEDDGGGEGWEGDEGDEGGSQVGGGSVETRRIDFMGGLSPPKSPAKVEAEARAALGPVSLMAQLRRVVAGLDKIAEEALAREIKSPVLSPPRGGFFTKKSDKKRMIVKLKEQLRYVESSRYNLADQMARSASTAGVVLSMLQDKWAASTNEIDSQTRELESAYEIVTRQEEEMNEMRTQLRDLKTQLEKAAQAAIATPTVIIQEKIIMSPSRSSTTEPLSPSTASTDLVPAGQQQQTDELVERLQCRVTELEVELDVLYGKLEALTQQHKMQQEKTSSINRKLQHEVEDLHDEVRHLHTELENRQAKYLQLKQHTARMEQELEANVGQVEAMRHQVELRTRKGDEQLWEATKKAKEMEDRLKDELFNGLKMKEEVKKVQEEYELLLGQFEAVKSQVELGNMEMIGLAQKHDEEVEDIYAKLGAKNEYADMLAMIRKDTEEEMTDLKDRLEVAETGKQHVEVAYMELQARHRDACARRLASFVGAQHRRLKREAVRTWKLALR